MLLFVLRKRVEKERTKDQKMSFPRFQKNSRYSIQSYANQSFAPVVKDFCVSLVAEYFFRNDLKSTLTIEKFVGF